MDQIKAFTRYFAPIAGTRRFLWSFLQATRVGRAVIITTHSMEEADALCDRIGIMVQNIKFNLNFSLW